MNAVTAPETDGFQFKLSFFYVMLFLSIGCYLPYFPLWLKSRGMEPEQIGFILAASSFMRIIFTPVVSIFADYVGNYRFILIFLAAGSLMCLIGLNFVSGFMALLLVTAAYAIFGSSLLPVTETMAMAALDDGKLNYGRARSWGSFSFIVASLGVGLLVDEQSGVVILPVLVACGGGILFSAVMLPKPQGLGRLRRAVTAVKGEFKLSGVLSLLRHPVFWLFLVSSGLGQASHAFYYGFSTVHWKSLGFSGSLIGTLWAVGVIAEILLFLYLGDWLRRFNPALLLLVGAGAAALRWGVTAFDPALWLLFPAQALHGLSFGIVHLGAVYFIARAVPKQYGATAQGLYATMAAGLFMGGAVLASGPLYEAIGAMGYLVMAGVAGLSVALGLVLLWSWGADGRKLASE